MPSKGIVQFDIDGCVAGYVDGLRGFCSREMTPNYPITYGMVEDGWFYDRAEFFDAHEKWLAGGILTTPLMEFGVAENMKRLQDAGYVIRIATAREGYGEVSTEAVERDTIAWLKKHNIPYDQLSLGHGSKTIGDVDWAIDDRPSDCVEVAAHCPNVRVLDLPYNQVPELEGFVRVNSIADFVDEILSS